MKLTTFKALTRFEQTLFGLPFLVSGALLPLVQLELEWNFRWLLIFPAFLLARISGMSFNQLIDAKIDAKNPRTQNRPIPSGRATEKQARIIAWSAFFLFLLTCWQINTLCFLVAPLAAALLFGYSYLKRVTVGCHFVLGVIHFLGPVMACIALTGSILVSSLFLGMVAAFSIIGNDIVYAIQDEEFDRENQLFSFPSRFGSESSLRVARVLHLCSLVMLFGVGVTAHLPVFFYLSIGAAAVAFHRFYRAVAQKMSEPLFFSCNVVISASVFGFILASVLWDAM